MKKKRFAGVLLSFVLLIGCATMSDVVRSKDQGMTKVYSVNVDQAWEIAKTVFRWEGADAIEEHRTEGYMLTSSGMNLISYGAVMGAWIEPVDKGNNGLLLLQNGEWQQTLQRH